MHEHARPLVVSVVELLRRPGSRREVHFAAQLEDLALTASGLPPGADVTADLTLDSLSDSIVVTGTVEAPWEGACRRCLRIARGVLRADVREVFGPEGDDSDEYPLTDDHIDLEPVVRDAVLLALPLAPLCETACPGPDPDDHPVEVGAEESRRRDPRWSALDALRFDP